MTPRPDPSAPSAEPTTGDRGRHRAPAWVLALRIALVAGVAAVIVGVGAANGVGPLARVTPPSEVTDPAEMLARSLQTVIDASSVHVEVDVAGHVPGPSVGRTEATVPVDGTTVTVDVRPQDARSHVRVVSPTFGVDLEALTLFDTLAVKEGGGPWTKLSLGSLVGDSGIDANPLTMVDRVRAWFAQPGAPAPTSSDVACSAPAGRCHQVRLTLPATTGEALGRLMPGGDPGMGATTGIVADLDAETLRPVQIVLTTTSADGSLAVTTTAEFSGWDAPSVIPDPPSG
jgi:hypothetical protein